MCNLIAETRFVIVKIYRKMAILIFKVTHGHVFGPLGLVERRQIKWLNNTI